MLRGIFGPRREEVKGDWMKQHNELKNLYLSSNVVEVIKSRRMRRVGHVACVCGRVEVCTGSWQGNLRERFLLEDPDVDGKIILRWIFRKWDVQAWTGLSCLRIGTSVRQL